MRKILVCSAFLVGMMVAGLPLVSASASPSYDCGRAESGSVEELVCKDSELSSLDNKLSEVFKEALAKERQNPQSTLKAEQRGWIKGRNDCWKSDDLGICVKERYQRRIAELQAKYRLVEMASKTFYECEKNPANEIVVSSFHTTPNVIIAERGDKSFLLYGQKKKGLYQGRNETIEIGDGTLKASFAYQSPFLNCQVRAGG